jgi:hypothetical protein
MPSNRLPKSSLSQVAFVHDYIQLTFEDEVLSLYNSVVVKTPRAEFKHGSAGFADAIVSLIGRTVGKVSSSSEHAIELQFECGTRVRVLRTTSDNRPESFTFHAHNGDIVAGQN